MKNKFFYTILTFAVAVILTSCSNTEYEYRLENDTGKVVYYSDDSRITSCTANELGQYDKLTRTTGVCDSFTNDLHYYFRLQGSSSYDYAELDTELNHPGQTAVFTLTLSSTNKIVIDKTYE